MCYMAVITKIVEPRFFHEAVKDSNWKEAMIKEIDALKKNNTWSVVDLPSGKKVINSKWVYKVKYNSDGSIERHKVCLVIWGDEQVEGFNCNETFTPIAKMASARTFLATAATKGWALYQIDIHNAFLHGDLEEEVYMTMPPGFHTYNPHKVCPLHISFYGLKQALR